MNYWVVIYRFAWVMLAVLVIVGLVCVFTPKCNSLRELQRRKSELEQKNRHLEDMTLALKRRQERFVSDPAFVERTAREIGMVKPNEIVFKFTNSERVNDEESQD